MAEKIHVLYVDDEPTLLDLCRTFLERSGDFTVTTATSAPEAIGVLEKERFDAIISDYQMPGMDGIEFLKHLKAEGNTTPFIIFTGKGREEVVIEALNAGADFYLQKGGEAKAQFAELAHKILMAVQHRIDAKALQAQTNLLISMINSSSDFIIFALDREYRYLAFNEKHRKEMQSVWKTDIRIGMSILDCMTDPVLRRAAQESIDRTLRGEVFTEIQHQPDPDIWYELNWNPIRQSTGDVIGGTVFIRDITERKQAEEAVRIAHEKYTKAFLSAPDAITISEFDSGRFIEVNDAATRIFGYSRDELIGKNALELGIWLNNDDRDRFIDQIKKHGKVSQFEVLERRKSGELYYALVNADIISIGNVPYLIAIIQDITEREQTEQALRESEERFKHISELIPDFAYSCRKEPGGLFTIDWITGAPEQITGYTTDEIKRMTCWKFLVIDEDIPVFEKNVTGLSPGESVRCELRIRRKDGGIIWLASFAKCVTDPKGPGYHCLYGGCRDITVRKQAEKALLESEAYYRTIFENTGTASVIVEEDTTISLANAEFANLCGYSREEIEGKRRWTEFVVKEDLEQMLAQHRLRRQDQKQAKLHYEFRFVKKSGEVRKIYLSIDVIPGTKKSVASLLDITGYKKAEQALRESEERFRHISELIPDFAYSCKKAPDGEFATDWITGAPEQITGYTIDEIKRMTCWKFLVIDEDIPVFEKNVTGLSPGESVRCELRIRRKDGGIIWLSSYAKCVTDLKEPGYHRLYGGCRNITKRKRTEEELQITQEKYTKAFLSVPDAITISELDSGRFIEVNDAATRIFGYSRDELIGKSTIELGIWRNKEDRDRLIDQVRKHGKVTQFEVLNWRKSGELYNALVNADTISIGNVPYLIAIIRDITDRKKVEEALVKSEEKFQSLYMHMIEGSALHELTYNDQGVPEDYVIIEVNPAFEIQLGISRDTVIGKTSREAYGVAEPPYLEIYARVALTGESKVFEAYFPPLAKHFSISAFCPHKGSFATVFEDITERKRMEEALVESEKKSRSLLECVPELILVHRNGTILYTNPAAVKTLGYQPHEVINSQVTDFIAPEFHERVAAAVRQRMGGKPVEPYEIDVMSRDGSRRTMVVNGNTIEFDGAPASLIILVDITERKKVEEALRESEERYRQFFATSRDCIFITSPEGKSIDFNDVALDLFGYSTREELAAIPISDLYENADSRIEQIALIRKNGYVQDYPVQMKKKDGTIIDTLITTVPLKADDGSVNAFFGTVRDVTEQKRSIEEIRTLQQFQQNIIDNANVWISVLDPKGKILIWNNAAEQISGYPAEDVIGKNTIWKQIYPDPVYRKQVAENILSIIRTNAYVENFETRIRTRGGDEKIVWWNTQPLRDESGKAVQFIAIGRDNTERKRVEEDLRESEERYSSLFDNSYSVSLLIDPDTGKIIDANAAASWYYGYSRDELASMGIYDLNRLLKEKVIRDLRKAKDEKAKHFFSTHYLASGEKRNVEIYSGPITLHGKTLFYSIIHDITERKQAEERLIALRQFEESVIKNANIWISVLDGKGNVSVWNRAAEEISGYRADEVIGTNTIWSRMYPDKEYRRTVTAKIKEVIGANKYLENFETRIRTKDGQEQIIWWNTRVLQDVPGLDETFIAIGKDVTDRKRAEEALRQANKQLNLLSDITRHDILNQLLVLRGYLELSHDAIDNPETLSEFIKKEQHAAITIEEQITFTRDYQNLGVAAPAWQNVNASIKAAVDRLQMRGIHVEPDPADPEVYADPLFEKVFYNLIDNALRYGGDQMKTIRVSSQESDTSLEIVYEDDGVGITDEDKKKLFQKGFGKHTGLGLFLSREILSITGMTITENGMPGRGARFEITVPKGMWRVNRVQK